MKERALSLLCLGSTLANASGFVSPGASPPMNIARDPSLMLDLFGKDRNGNVIRVPVKNIERDWNFEGIEGTGKFSAQLFMPEDGEIRGCAFFMHGFSQYPVAYYETLKTACEEAKVAVIAVETGITSSGVFIEAVKARRSDLTPQDILQRALSEDTKQCIRMLKNGDDAFAEQGVTKSAVGDKIAVMGHSMGGGLSFPVAADCDINYVFTMAPAFGVESFDPITEGIEKGTPKESMLLAGGWDLIAPAAKVKEIAQAANSKIKKSSIFVNIKRGLHTGFEDDLVLFDVKLDNVVKVTSTLGKVFGLYDALIFNTLKFVGFVRSKTGQIEGSTVLMTYFLSAMAGGKSITAEDAEKYLDDNIKDIFEEKFEFSYPEN